MTPNGSDRVEEGAGGAIWLICAAPKGWTARRGRPHTSSEYPGTAIRWEARLYEVVEALTDTDGKVRYRLESWPDRHAVRAIQTYDGETEARRAAEQAGHHKSVRCRRLAILLSPVLGHLPGPVQERMESEFGAPAIAMTAVSAFPLFALGIVSALFSLAEIFGSGFSVSGGREPHLLPLTVALYFVVESGVRLGMAFLLARPTGSLPGTLLYEIWRTARGLPPVSEASFRGLRVEPEQALEDRFRMLEPLFALLSRREQEILELRFGMKVLRWGKITALVLLAAGGLNAVASAASFAAGRGSLGDLAWFLAGAALSIEQIARLREISLGKPAGSILGAFVRPLARGLLSSPSSNG
jgi:hypothetical protein